MLRFGFDLVIWFYKFALYYTEVFWNEDKPSWNQELKVTNSTIIQTIMLTGYTLSLKQMDIDLIFTLSIWVLDSYFHL